MKGCHLYKSDKKNPREGVSFSWIFLLCVILGATNTIYNTGCIGLQSCIEMQPKTGMQPTNWN